MAVRSKLAILGGCVAATVLLVGPPCFVASTGRLSAALSNLEAGTVTPMQPVGSKATIRLQDEVEPSSAFRVGSAVVSVLAALLVALAPAAEAQAARTGGRIGSSAPSRQEQRKPPPAARQAMEPPRVINKTTVVQKTVVVPPPPPPVIIAPTPMFSPFGAPVVVAPPPTVGDIIVGAAVSGAINSTINSTIPRGPSTTDRIMENQIRQDERQLDRQSSQIDDLQRELRELKK
jgi:hypothetical protein